jgi:hypothetical protein
MGEYENVENMKVHILTSGIEPNQHKYTVIVLQILKYYIISYLKDKISVSISKFTY